MRASTSQAEARIGGAHKPLGRRPRAVARASAPRRAGTCRSGPPSGPSARPQARAAESRAVPRRGTRALRWPRRRQGHGAPLRCTLKARPPRPFCRKRGAGKLSRRPSGSGTCRCTGRRPGSRKARSVPRVAGAMGDALSPRGAGRRCSPKRCPRESGRGSSAAAAVADLPTDNGTARPPARPRAYPARHAGCGSHPEGGAGASAERGGTASIRRCAGVVLHRRQASSHGVFSRRRAHGQGATAGCIPSCAVLLRAWPPARRAAAAAWRGLAQAARQPRLARALAGAGGGGGGAPLPPPRCPAQRRLPFARAGPPPQAPAAMQQLLRTLPQQFPWQGWRPHKVAGALGKGPVGGLALSHQEREAARRFVATTERGAGDSSNAACQPYPGGARSPCA